MIRDARVTAQKLSSSYKQLIIDGVLVAAPSCAHGYPPRLGIRMRQQSRIKDYPPRNGGGQRWLG
jgi:hypothetical protein